ncbi:hypothetical protein J6590_091306 [Homalodisca vitripennis]|nr:hypothetical protein J6590_091306 [Homalodisca vitripennis]
MGSDNYGMYKTHGREKRYKQGRVRLDALSCGHQSSGYLDSQGTISLERKVVLEVVVGVKERTKVKPAHIEIRLGPRLPQGQSAEGRN